MPWCPKCKAEYREGIEICNDCKTELVKEREELKEEKIDYDREAFLISVSGEFEASTIEALLKFYDVPVLRKHRGSGGYLEIYMGMSNTGIDLFVPSRFLEEAKEIIRNELEETIVEDDDIGGFDERYIKKRRIRTWIALLFFIPGIIWIVFMNIYLFIQMLIK